MTDMRSATRAQQDEYLRSKFTELTYDQIAASFGVNRSVICGRAHRMGLIKMVHSRSYDTAFQPSKRDPFIKSLKSTLPMIEPPQPDDKRKDLKNLIELEDNECHWPIGTPGADGFGFCGRVSWFDAGRRRGHGPMGACYCEEHARRAGSVHVKRMEKEDRFDVPHRIAKTNLPQLSVLPTGDHDGDRPPLRLRAPELART